MSFIWPAMLAFLLVIPLFVVLYRVLHQRRQRVRATLGGFGLAQSGSGQSVGRRRHIPPALFLMGLALLLLALARPEAAVSLPRVEGTLILAFDVSGSMAAEDLPPTRMEAAKEAARAFVQRQPGSVQIGIVAFSEGGISVQPPTSEQATILASLNRLTPERSTSLGNGILASLNAILVAQGQLPQANPLTPLPTPSAAPAGSNSSAIIVLITDGENTAPPDPYEAARQAADLGVRIHTVGIGSATGTTLNINGFSVHTQLDEATLREIARLTGGSYYNAANEEDFATIYDNLETQLVTKSEKMEVTALFAAASMVVLLVGGACSLLWFGRVP